MNMKKILLTIALIITMGLTANAQYNSDGFFNSWDKGDRYSNDDMNFVLPTAHGNGTDANASPLGSGLLVLTVLGAGYALKKKLKK